jgi:hypothetical protein
MPPSFGEYLLDLMETHPAWLLTVEFESPPGILKLGLFDKVQKRGKVLRFRPITIRSGNLDAVMVQLDKIADFMGRDKEAEGTPRV